MILLGIPPCQVLLQLRVLPMVEGEVAMGSAREHERGTAVPFRVYRREWYPRGHEIVAV